MKIFPSIHDTEVSSDDLQRKSFSHQAYSQQVTVGKFKLRWGG